MTPPAVPAASATPSAGTPDAPGGGADATDLGKVSGGLVTTPSTADVVAGPDGSIWVADPVGARIWRYGLDGLLLDSFPTTNAVWELTVGPDGNAWATSSPANAVGRITAGHDVTWFTDATIQDPRGIVAGPDGALWFVNHAAAGTVGRITTVGAVTNLAVTGIGGAVHLAFTPNGDLWIGSDLGYSTPGTITRRQGDGTTTNYAIPGTQSGVMAMVAGPQDKVWFIARSDGGWGGSLRSIGVDGQIADVDGLWLQDLVVGPDGALWYTDLGVFDPLTLPWNPGSVRRWVPGGSPQNIQTLGHGPGPLTTGPDGNVWFLNQGKDYLKGRGGPSLGQVTVPQLQMAMYELAPIGEAPSLAFDPSQRLWIADATNASNTALEEKLLSTHATTISPRSIATAANGTVWSTGPKVAAPATGGVARTGTDGTTTVFEDAQLPDPASITVGNDGNAWFLTTSGGAIGKITPEGAMTRFADPLIDAGLTTPHDIVAGPGANLWFANASSLGRITPAGVVTTFAPPTGTIAPEQLAFDAAGNLWFTDAQHHAIGRRTTGGAFTIYTDDRIVAPHDLAVGPDGAVWFTNARVDNSASIGYLSTTGALSFFRNPTIYEPLAIVKGPDGDMWFSERYNRIWRIGTNAVAAAPSIPTGLTATSIGSRQIKVTWKAPDFAGSKPVVNYVVVMVRQDDEGHSLGACVTGGAARECTVSNVEATKFYKFLIRAVNGVGSSPLSQPTPYVMAPFLDIASGAPFEADITWMAAFGLTTGYADGTFRPLGNVDRQSMAAFVARRVFDSFDPCTEPPFTDVAIDSPFCKHIRRLKLSQIVGGYPDGSFHPYALVTREATGAFLFRATHPLGTPKPLCDGEAPFIDVPTSATFCGEIAWMKAEGISTGYGDGSFHPQETITRQAMAAFLHRSFGPA